MPGLGERFCCGYTADDGVCGYFVLSYTGEGLARLDGAATPYPYDLRANLDGFQQALSGTQLDLETACATRVQATLADGTRAEAVRFVDGEGRRAICRFGEDGPVLVSPIP